MCKARYSAIGRIHHEMRGRHIDAKYAGIERIELGTLVVKPPYQRQGIGKALTEWGMSYVAERGAIIECFASLPGRGLYLGLGFREAEKTFVQVAGEEETVDEYLLIYDPSESKKVDPKSPDNESTEAKADIRASE